MTDHLEITRRLEDRAPKDWTHEGMDGELQEPMVTCIESLIGREHGGEGGELEQEVVVIRNGNQLLSTFAWNPEILH